MTRDMKKILLYFAAGAMLLSSCDLDINENPNYPSSSSVTDDLIFPAAENAIADCLGDQMFNYAGFFAQYFDQNPTSNQYNDLAELNLDESSDLFRRCYTYLYAGALTDLQTILDRSTNTSDIFACTVLRAQAFQLVVDNLSDAPYSEALQGSDNTTPKWDDGKTVYEGILAELDEAEAALDGSAMTVTDPMLGKSVSQWKGYANALRLRIYLRLIDGNIDASTYTAKAKALVAANEFFTGDVVWDVYSNASGQYNPWYDTYHSLGTRNHCAAYSIISYMSVTSDPRISYGYAKCAKDGTYVGQLPGCKTLMGEWTGATYNDDNVSGVNYSVMVASPIYLFTQSELQFLIAEVELRFNNNDAAAQTAYENAVAEDFSSKGVEGVSTFLSGIRTGWDNMASTSEKLNLIYMQKWVALNFRDHMEAWSEIRRTDVPALSSASAKQIYESPMNYNAGDMIEPGVNYIVAKGLCKRVPYPSNARTLNPSNTPAAKLLSDPVFWDVK